MAARFLDFPWHLDGRGGVAVTSEADHVRDLIFQVLFTAPGERVNRPDFGCGLRQLIFMPNSDALAAATQFLVHGSLQRWLGDVIQVEQVQISALEESLVVEVSYLSLSSGQRHQERFVAPGGGC